MINLFRTLLSDEEGATMVEYAMLLALIVAVLIGVWTLLGETIRDRVNQVIEGLGGDTSSDSNTP